MTNGPARAFARPVEGGLRAPGLSPRLPSAPTPPRRVVFARRRLGLRLRRRAALGAAAPGRLRAADRRPLRAGNGGERDRRRELPPRLLVPPLLPGAGPGRRPAPGPPLRRRR